MSDSTPQTLGQRIDAVLNPLYSEAEQHRAALAQAEEKREAIQQEIDTATQGLAQVESRMAEVVRSLAGHEPVLAAVLGTRDNGEATEAAPAAIATEAEQAAQSEPAPEPETPKPAPPKVETPKAVAASVESSHLSEPEAVPLNLDPEVDAAMVDEAAALLDSFDEDELDSTPSDVAQGQTASAQHVADLPPDITAAAERAAAAAKQLRDKAAPAE